MSYLFLNSALANAEFALARQIALLQANRLAPRKGIHAMCTMFRKRGVCALLLTGDASPFYVTAMQSAAAFLQFLRKAPAAEQVTSYIKPLFDCLAGGYWEAAAQIATKSRDTRNPDWEYEEDYLYARFVMRHCLLAGSDSEGQDILSQYEAITGSDDDRLQLCQSLLARDSAAFEAALTELLSAREEKLNEAIGQGRINDEEAAWLRPYSCEAAALLRIADRWGLHTQETYAQVPSAIRPASPYAFSAEAWRSLDFRPEPA